MLPGLHLASNSCLSNFFIFLSSFFLLFFFSFSRRLKVIDDLFYSCRVVICRAPFRLLHHSKIPGCHCINPSFSSVVAGSPGAVRAWSPPQSSGSEVQASVTLKKLSYFASKASLKDGTPDGSPNPCCGRVPCALATVCFPIVAVVVHCFPFPFLLGIFLR